MFLRSPAASSLSIDSAPEAAEIGLPVRGTAIQWNTSQGDNNDIAAGLGNDSAIYGGVRVIVGKQRERRLAV